MHSPTITPKLKTEIPSDIDNTVIDIATEALLEQFCNDPVHYASYAKDIAISTPTLTVNPDNPTKLAVTALRHQLRIDKNAETFYAVEHVCTEYRIVEITASLCIIEARAHNALCDAWAKTSRSANMHTLYRVETHQRLNIAAHTYFPLPEIVEEYATSLGYVVLDARGTHPGHKLDCTPFEMPVDAYIQAENDRNTLAQAISSNSTWWYFNMGDRETLQPRALRCVPARTLAAFMRSCSAKELTANIFGTHMTKNVIREVGKSTHPAAIIIASMLMRPATPPDWVANLLAKINESFIDAPLLQHGDYIAIFSQLGPFIDLIPDHDYLRMFKPLCTNNTSFNEFCATLNIALHNITQPPAFTRRMFYPHHTVNLFAYETDYTKHVKTIQDFNDLIERFSVNEAFTQTTLTAEEFYAWLDSPAGKFWQKKAGSSFAQDYTDDLIQKLTYTSTIQAIDHLQFEEHNITLKLAIGAAEYVALGKTLQNCIKNYSYNPETSSIFAIMRHGKPIGAMEVTKPANPKSDSAPAHIQQIYGPRNTHLEEDGAIVRKVDKIIKEQAHSITSAR